MKQLSPRVGLRRPSARSILLHLLAWLIVGASTAVADPADINWSSNFGAPGVTGSVKDVANWGGTLVVGGQLSHAGGVRVKNVVAWNGSEFQQMGAGLNGTVTSLAVVGGVLYAAGEFDSSGATPLPHLAMWSGSTWVTVGAGAPDDPLGLTVVEDGSSLLLLGAFTTVGSPPVAASCIASWNGTSWSAVGSFPGTDQLTCAARLGSTLYVGGVYGGSESLHAFDGANWSPVVSVDGDVTSLAAVGGYLYIVGDFSTVDSGNLAAYGIASWDGAAFATLADIEPDGQFLGIGVDSGELLAVGNFFSTPGYRTARWDGTSWNSGPFGVAYPVGGVSTFARIGGDLYCGGDFSKYYDTGASVIKGASGIMRYDGSQWLPMGPGSGVLDDSPFVRGLTVFNNRLIATGDFKTIGNQGAVQGIAAWDGTAWTKLGSGLAEAFGNPTGSNLAVWNSQLVVSGYFTGAPGVNSENIIAWNGTSWQGLDGGFTGQNAAVISYNTQLIAATGVSSLGTAIGTGTPLGAVARWTGTQWQTIGTTAISLSLTNIGLTVWDGKLIYGASFSSINGVPANNVAAWDGTSWSALGNGFNNFVTSVGVYNNELYASGLFTHTGATPLPGRIARWDGSAWVAVGSGLDASALSLVSAGGKLYATGFFSTAGGSDASRIASWDGSSWAALGSGLDAGLGTAQGYDLAEFDGGLYAGGFQVTAGDKLSRGIARWNLSAPSGVELPVRLPGLILGPPSPNPAHGRVSLAFENPAAGEVEATVFDANGRRVQTLLAAHLSAGTHDVSWDGRDSAGRLVTSGVYWVRVSSASGKASVKVVWVR